MKKEITYKWAWKLINLVLLQDREFKEALTRNIEKRKVVIKQDEDDIIYILIDDLGQIVLDRELGRVEFKNFTHKEVVNIYRVLKLFVAPLYVVSIK